jgi:AhpD family alkylhydroperoxidase
VNVEPRPLKAYPWYMKPFFAAQRRRYGVVLTPGLLWGRVPRLYVALATFYGALERKGSPLSPALRALILTRVSQINDCAFCVDINAGNLLSRGANPQKVDDLARWRQAAIFTDEEQVALDYAEAMTLSDRRVTPETLARVRPYFDGDRLIELTALIAFQNMSTKFNSALGIPPQGFCQRPSITGR